MMSTNQRTWTTEQIAKAFYRSLETVRKNAREGRLKGYKPRGGRKYVFLDEDVKRWLAGESSISV